MASHDPPRQLLEVAEKIADGTEVDWGSLGEEIAPDLLARLRDIQSLVGRVCEKSDDSSLLKPGAQFARLLILDEIGSGANGVVYRARDPIIEREVALKLCVAGPARRDALLREAQQMARVDHPNVLKVHGAAEQDGLVGFWSDLISGETLDAWSNSRIPLGASELIALGLELCSAAAAIHAVGLVHGDIKPGNIIRHSSGRWVLVDFGSCTSFSDTMARTGTPLYLAPELIAGGAPGVSTDIYALGVVLFRLASGHYPVEADDFHTLVDKHQQGTRYRLLDFRPDLNIHLVAAIEGAIALRAEGRYVSVGQFAHALGSALPRERTTTRRGVASALVGVVTGLVMLTIALWQWNPTHSAPEVELQRVVNGMQHPLRDGDMVQPGDGLALRYRNSRSAYVYVINEDGNGEAYQLFPLRGSELSNPLPAGQEVRLPGRVGSQEMDWQVTSRGGEERFFVVIAQTPLPEFAARNLAQSGDWEALLSTRPLALNSLGPVRGTAGLRPRDPTAVTRVSHVAAWIAELNEAYPDVEVVQFGLRNP